VARDQADVRPSVIRRRREFDRRRRQLGHTHHCRHPRATSTGAFPGAPHLTANMVDPHFATRGPSGDRSDRARAAA